MAKRRSRLRSLVCVVGNIEGVAETNGGEVIPDEEHELLIDRRTSMALDGIVEIMPDYRIGGLESVCGEIPSRANGDTGVSISGRGGDPIREQTLMGGRAGNALEIMEHLAVTFCRIQVFGNRYVDNARE